MNIFDMRNFKILWKSNIIQDTYPHIYNNSEYANSKNF